MTTFAHRESEPNCGPCGERIEKLSTSLLSTQTTPATITKNEEPMTDSIHGAAGVFETLDMMEQVAAAESAPTGKKEQNAIVRTIGERMRQAREMCNLSQSEAARQFGYANPSKLSKVEAAIDTNSVPLWLIRRAAEVYEVSVDFLFGLSEDWETGAPRGTQAWLLDAWNKMRLRDIGLLDRVHSEAATVACTTSNVLDAVRGVGDALTVYRERNPGFDDSAASSLLVSRISRLEMAAKRAEAGLKRFQLGKFGAEA